MNRESVSLEMLIRHFEVYNRSRNRSAQTIQWHNQKLGEFLMWLQEQGLAGCLRDFTIERVRDFVLHLQTRNTLYERGTFARPRQGRLSDYTVQGYVRVLRSFSTWLYQEEYTDNNVLRPLRPPTVERRVVETLSPEEIHQALRSIDTATALGARDYAMVYLMLDCGIRAGELCAITLEDVHVEDGYIRIRGKGRKQRLVPTGYEAQKALMRYLARYRHLLGAVRCDRFFLSREGRPLTVSALEQVVRRVGLRAGLKKFHPHLLRHTFATNYLLYQLGDPFRLQQMLGHTTLEMVRHYVAVANIQQSLLERRASPMDILASHQTARKASVVSQEAKLYRRDGLSQLDGGRLRGRQRWRSRVAQD